MNSIDRRKFVALVGSLTATNCISKNAYGRLVDSKPKDKIKVGQIGVGHAHASKLAQYRNLPDYDVVGVCESNEDLRRSSADKAPYRDLKWMTQEELLNIDGLQVVLVETEVKNSLAAAEKCIDAGMHIHLDKPAGESLSHFKRILDKAKAKNLMVQMGYMYRYNPAIVLLRDCLKKGWLGEVFELHTVMSKVINAKTRAELGEYPGGTMFELGCHIMDLTIGVLGKPQKVTSISRHSSPIKDKLVDNMLAILEYQSAIATVKTTAQEVDGFARRHFVVCGTEGTFHIQPLDNPKARVTFSKSRGKYKKGYQDIEFPKYRRYVDDAVDMAKILRGEKESDFSYEHDFVVQETLLKASNLKID